MGVPTGSKARSLIDPNMVGHVAAEVKLQFGHNCASGASRLQRRKSHYGACCDQNYEDRDSSLG